MHWGPRRKTKTFKNNCFYLRKRKFRYVSKNGVGITYNKII